MHKNELLNPVDKFAYLRSVLIGEAFKSVDDLSVTNNNYDLAWKTLLERYNSRKKLININLTSLFAFPRVYRENYTDLRRLVTSLSKIVHSLPVLYIPVNSWNAIFVHLGVDKLDLVTKKHWETQTKDVKDPSFDEFKSFVLGQCQILENVEPKMHPFTSQGSIKKPFKKPNVMVVQNKLHQMQ